MEVSTSAWFSVRAKNCFHSSSFEQHRTGSWRAREDARHAAGVLPILLLQGHCYQVTLNQIVYSGISIAR